MQNRKTELPGADAPAAALWPAILQLPKREQRLLRVLLTWQDERGREYDFEHPKSTHHIREVAAALGVTERTVRNMLQRAIANPVLQRAALRVAPTADVAHAGLNYEPCDTKGAGTPHSVRTWSSDDGGHTGFKAQGNDSHYEPRRSHGDWTRRDWVWRPERQRDMALRKEPWAILGPATPWVASASARPWAEPTWGQSQSRGHSKWQWLQCTPANHAAWPMYWPGAKDQAKLCIFGKGGPGKPADIRSVDHKTLKFARSNNARGGQWLMIGAPSRYREDVAKITARRQLSPQEWREEVERDDVQWHAYDLAVRREG